MREMEVGHAPCLEKFLGEKIWHLLDGRAGETGGRTREAECFSGSGDPRDAGSLESFQRFVAQARWKRVEVCLRLKCLVKLEKSSGRG